MNQTFASLLLGPSAATIECQKREVIRERRRPARSCARKGVGPPKARRHLAVRSPDAKMASLLDPDLSPPASASPAQSKGPKRTKKGKAPSF